MKSIEEALEEDYELQRRVKEELKERIMEARPRVFNVKQSLHQIGYHASKMGGGGGFLV